MKLILKIAAGVFLGLVAIGMLLEIRTRFTMWSIGPDEATRQLEFSRLTPDKVIARCGVPLKDETQQQGPEYANRAISYKNTLSQIVTVNFGETNPKWVWTPMFVSAEDGHGTNDENIAMLPCLLGK